MVSKICKTCGHGVTKRALEILRQKEEKKKPPPPRRKSKKEKVRDLARMFLQRYQAEDD
jgi:hypothetical protein